MGPVTGISSKARYLGRHVLRGTWGTISSKPIPLLAETQTGSNMWDQGEAAPRAPGLCKASLAPAAPPSTQVVRGAAGASLLGWRCCCNSSNANFQSPCASIPLPGAHPAGPMHTTTHGAFHYKPQSDKECLADIKDISHLPIWWKVLLLAENREDCYSKIYHMAPLC